jgi:hypothetical protein
MWNKNALILKVLLTSTLLFLASCQTANLPVEPQVIRVPVPVKCVNAPWPDSPIRDVVGNTRERLVKTLIYIEELEKYVTKLKTILAGCS